MKIPLNKPYWGRTEERAAALAMRGGTGVGDGKYTREATEKLLKLVGAKFGYLVTSCTSAMDIALMAIGLKEGDEVIVPSFTLSSTATAILMAGGKPVFADIDPVTYCIDPVDIGKVITKRTRGIMVVHYAGMPAPMEKILALAKRYRLFVVEDAAPAIGAYYRGKHLGTFGMAGAFSFHGTKNVSCGEGGAIVTDDEELAEQMDIIRAVGTNRSAFLAGKVSLYEWVGKGSSYFLSDILASLLVKQLDKITTIGQIRQQIASYYNKVFCLYASMVQLPIVPTGATANWHIYALKFNTEAARKTFQKKMRGAGIEVSTHYVPLHTAPMGRKLGAHRRKLPVTEEVARTLVRLPIYPGLITKELVYITKTAQRILVKM